MLSNFSNGEAVDSVETEKSRIVLKEFEHNWWILASIDLTRLPAAAKNVTATDKDAELTSLEYSAREVAPPELLLAQLEKAHNIFLLHQASGLTDLLKRLGRDRFTETIDKFWSGFARNWDVLLHGNPAVDVYNAVHLSGGGELGVGVGEEEWGSGEREVLEDFVQRTEGLVDVFVGRYGDAPPLSEKAEKKQSFLTPWLGLGDDARASDGILFSGTGTLSHRSIATVSQWMDTIFKHGVQAYGIADNPNARTRHRRKRQKLGENEQHGSSSPRKVAGSPESRSRVMSPKGRSPDYRRKAMERTATAPGIPPPLVSAVESSLNEAVKKANNRDANVVDQQELQIKPQEQDQSYFDTEKMMGLLKLGYGSSWTLNPQGFVKEKPEPETAIATGSSPPSSSAPQPTTPTTPAGPQLQIIEPTPEISDDEAGKEEKFKQHLEQSIGRFLVGLSGDLENTEFDPDPADDPEPSFGSQSKRIYIRTITVQLSESHTVRSRRESSPRRDFSRSVSRHSKQNNELQDPKTSGAASVDGVEPNTVTQKVRVVVYIHQPFIFTFLFDVGTANLSLPGFYRSIHNQLGPLQKPLLRSTDPARIPERVLSLLGAKNPNVEAQSAGLYDLVYDPVKRTVRSSIPNIPLPGTLAAEGIQTARTSGATVSGSWYTLGIPIGSLSGSSTSTVRASDGTALLQTDWTRLEALNVHSQVLNIYASTRQGRTAKLNPSGDLERTVKTARGWWLVWMRVPHGLPSANNTRPNSSATMRRWRREDGAYDCKEAFLVRKAPDASLRGKDSNVKSATSGRWLLRDQTRDVNGSTASQSAAPTSARGVIEGVGVDARRWVEGLSKLSQ